MKLVKAEFIHIPELVSLSKEAFESDVFVGAPGTGGPPEYDSEDWHVEMMNSGRLFTAISENRIVGGAVLFCERPSFVYVGRIFVDPAEFRKGYGTGIMRAIEQMHPEAAAFALDTPIWNIRTNSFYTKLGYREVRRDEAFIYYQKDR